MSTRTDLPADQPIIVMTRTYDAPRALVWEAMTDPKHVREWWGGPGFTNPVCEMDVRPGGRWKHVMRFPDGFELHMELVFVEVEAPSRLVWRHADQGERSEGPPASTITVTLEELGGSTRCTISARFSSMADRAKALEMGYTRPIEASNERLAQYLPTMARA